MLAENVAQLWAELVILRSGLTNLPSPKSRDGFLGFASSASLHMQSSCKQFRTCTQLPMKRRYLLYMDYGFLLEGIKLKWVSHCQWRAKLIEGCSYIGNAPPDSPLVLTGQILSGRGKQGLHHPRLITAVQEWGFQQIICHWVFCIAGGVLLRILSNKRPCPVERGKACREVSLYLFLW